MADTDLKSTAAQIRKSIASYEYFFDNWPTRPGSKASMRWAFSGTRRSRNAVKTGCAIPGGQSPVTSYVSPRKRLTRCWRWREQFRRQTIRASTKTSLRSQLNYLGLRAAELARKETKWLRSYTSHLVGIPSAAVPLLTHLTGEGQAKAAFNLAGALLTIMSTGKRTGREAAIARISEYEYSQVVKGAWPTFIQADPGRALSFLCDRLNEVIHAGDDNQGGADLAYFWRRAVEDHAQNVGRGFLGTLVDAVRDCSLAVAQTPGGWEVTMSILQAMLMLVSAVSCCSTGISAKPKTRRPRGVVERLQGYLETNFEPGRRFANHLDFQSQLDAWFQKTNRRAHRTLKARPIDRFAEEHETMRPLPEKPPDVDRRWVLRVAPDPYLRFDTNDYSLDPDLVGRRVEITATQREIAAIALDTGEVACSHERSFAKHRTITALEHARTLRERRGQRAEPEPGSFVQQRALTVYDQLIA